MQKQEFIFSRDWRGRQSPALALSGQREDSPHQGRVARARVRKIPYRTAFAVSDSALPCPDRTLTFLWVDEIRGSRQWISARPGEARHVRYMFSMDMTGEDTSKTGGSFLIEKQADPLAVWERPSDPHSEWGACEVKAESLQGSLLRRSCRGS